MSLLDEEQTLGVGADRLGLGVRLHRLIAHANIDGRRVRPGGERKALNDATRSAAATAGQPPGLRDWQIEVEDTFGGGTCRRLFRHRFTVADHFELIKRNQASRFSMNVDEKLKMARQLERLQVDIIEAGFPIASEGDFEAVKKISSEIRSVTIAGLARALPADIDRCWEALEHAARPRIHTFLATSDIHLKYKFNKTRGEFRKANPIY